MSSIMFEVSLPSEGVKCSSFATFDEACEWIVDNAADYGCDPGRFDITPFEVDDEIDLSGEFEALSVADMPVPIEVQLDDLIHGFKLLGWNRLSAGYLATILNEGV